MKKDIKVTAISHHRNGVSGEPFYVVLFEHEKRNMMAIVFDETSYVAVLDRDLLATGESRFFYNSWRGDYYESDLRSAIKEWESEDK